MEKWAEKSYIKKRTKKSHSTERRNENEKVKKRYRSESKEIGKITEKERECRRGS